MAKKKISGMMLIPELNLVKYVEIENNFELIKGMLGFDLADIVERQINGKYFDIVCDDNALLKPNPIPAAIEKGSRQVLICGNIFICHHDDEGNLTSAKEEEFENMTMVQACTVDEDGINKRFLMIEMEY